MGLDYPQGTVRWTDLLVLFLCHRSGTARLWKKCGQGNFSETGFGLERGKIIVDLVTSVELHNYSEEIRLLLVAHLDVGNSLTIVARALETYHHSDKTPV